MSAEKTKVLVLLGAQSVGAVSMEGEEEEEEEEEKEEEEEE